MELFISNHRNCDNKQVYMHTNVGIPVLINDARNNGQSNVWDEDRAAHYIYLGELGLGSRCSSTYNLAQKDQHHYYS